MRCNYFCFDPRELFSLAWGYHCQTTQGKHQSTTNKKIHYWADGMNVFTNGKISFFVFIPQHRARDRSMALVRKISSPPNNHGNFMCINFYSFVTQATARRNFPPPRAKPFTTFFAWFFISSVRSAKYSVVSWHASLLFRFVFLDLVTRTFIHCLVTTSK